MEAHRVLLACMKLRIATKLLLGLLPKILPKKIPEGMQLQINADDSGVALQCGNGSITTKEAEVFEEGKVCLQARLFTKIVSSYDGTPSLELETSDMALRINSFKAPILSWTPPTKLARKKGFSKGANLVCQVDTKALLGYFRSVIALHYNESVTLVFKPGWLEMVSTAANTTLPTNGNFSITAMLSHTRIRRLCLLKEPKQAVLTLQLNIEAKVLSLDHWDSPVKFISVPSKEITSDTCAHAVQLSEATNIPVQTEAAPFSKFVDLPFITQVFMDCAKFIKERFALKGEDLIKLEMSLDDLDNIHRRAPRYLTRFGLEIEHEPGGHFFLTLQFMTFEVSRERLEICYGEAMPGDHSTNVYIAFPDGTEVRDLDVVCALDDLKSLSGHGSKPIILAEGTMKFADDF